MDEPLAVRSRRAVDRVLARLRECYGDFPAGTVTVENDPDFFAEGADLFAEGVRGGAGARVTDAEGRLLLIRDPRAGWALPGGGQEPGESFEACARRETREEAGVDCEITGVWSAQRRRFVHRESPERRAYLLQVLFTARYTGGEPCVRETRLDDEETVLDEPESLQHAP